MNLPDDETTPDPKIKNKREYTNFPITNEMIKESKDWMKRHLERYKRRTIDQSR